MDTDPIEQRKRAGLDRSGSHPHRRRQQRTTSGRLLQKRHLRLAGSRNPGELVLQLATVLHGVIDFDGALVRAASHARIERATWPGVARSVHEFLARIPGNVVEIEHQVNENRVWACHAGDCEFMRGWLQHPDFHMIK